MGNPSRKPSELSSDSGRSKTQPPLENSAQNKTTAKEKEQQKIKKKEAKKAYEKTLKILQIELLKLQNHVKANEERILLIFEGRDAAGKGGTIKRITEHLNPRGARVVALEKPSDRERTQWYFQRYVAHLPSGGEIVIFDRSWYNRAMVEPVMGYCTDEQNKRFLKYVSLLERMLVKDGMKMFKFYFSVSKAEQNNRFESRIDDPLKQYKLSPVDLKAQELWDKYTLRKFEMLTETNRTISPWTIIRSDNKKLARLNCIKYILSNLEYKGKTDSASLEPDPKVVISGIDEIRNMEESLLANFHRDGS